MEKLPECFPETESSDKFGSSHKISDVPSSRTVLSDPEYLTLAKLLSFLHGALILRGEKACHSDIIRLVSFISFFFFYTDFSIELFLNYV